jgi:hypothetical protein
MIGRSSVLVFFLGMGTMFLLLYFSITYSPDVIPVARITQAEALSIADADLNERLSDYKGIVGIIDTSWSKYVPVDEFQQNDLKLPLVYIPSNGSLIFVTASGYENHGMCDTGLFAYCGWYAKYNFDYGSRLVYGVELKVDSNERTLVMYMVDATNGKIVDSTFLRHEWIRAHSTEES